MAHNFGFADFRHHGGHALDQQRRIIGYEHSHDCRIQLPPLPGTAPSP
jgi:hypothetical protein